MLSFADNVTDRGSWEVRSEHQYIPIHVVGDDPPSISTARVILALPTVQRLISSVVKPSAVSRPPSGRRRLAGRCRQRSCFGPRRGTELRRATQGPDDSRYKSSPVWAEKRSGSVRLRIEPDGAKRRNTYKIAEFVEGDSPVPSMFEPSGATVVSIDGPRIAALAQFLL